MGTSALIYRHQPLYGATNRKMEEASWQNINYWNRTLCLFCEWHSEGESFMGPAFVNGRGPPVDTDLVDRVTFAGIQGLSG